MHLFSLDFHKYQLALNNHMQHKYEPPAVSTSQFASYFASPDKPTLLIDNGSYELRAGYNFSETPTLRFRNHTSKPRYLP